MGANGPAKNSIQTEAEQQSVNSNVAEQPDNDSKSDEAKQEDEKINVSEQLHAEVKQDQGAPNDSEDDMKKAAQHLEEMGLGSADVILELLKLSDGSVQRTLETLLRQTK